MQLKDIVKITIFSVIGFILMMLGGALSSVSGVYMAYMQNAVGSLLTAPVYFVMCRKVRKRGTSLLYYLINGIVYTIMGFWPMILILLAAGIVSELIIGKKENYDDNKRLAPAFIAGEMIHALHGVIFILVLGVNGIVAQFPEMFTQEAAQQMYDMMANAKGITLIIVFQLIFSVLGVFFGRYIYNKFFAKNSSNKGILN